jgi:hypothetical protein
VTDHHFRGYVLAWNESWYRGVDSSTVGVACVDELGSLARFDGYEQSPVGDGELFGLRMHRILDTAGHGGSRQIEVGEHTMQPTTLAGNCVSELKLVADSEGGTVWVEGDGTIVAEGRDSVFSDSRSNSVQASFGDGDGELPYRDVTLAYDGDIVANVVAFASSGGTAQTVDDLTSRALYGDKRYARSDLVCEGDLYPEILATLWLERHKEPELRFTALQVIANGDEHASLFPQVLRRKPLDRIEVTKRPPAGDTITREVLIGGVHHRIDSVAWSTVWDLVSTTGYPGADEFGVWDVSNWNECVWGVV